MYDCKGFSKDVFKSKQAFLISEQHRIEISGSTVKVAPNFHETLKECHPLKRGKSLNSFLARDLLCAPTNGLMPAKKNDVLRLLRLIGVDANHPAYDFYKESCAPTVCREQEQEEAESEISE